MDGDDDNDDDDDDDGVTMKIEWLTKSDLPQSTSTGEEVHRSCT